MDGSTSVEKTDIQGSSYSKQGQDKPRNAPDDPSPRLCPD